MKYARLTAFLAVTALMPMLAACARTSAGSEGKTEPIARDLGAMYGEIMDGDTTVPAIDVTGMYPKNARQVVTYRTQYPPGTIVVDPYQRFLYLVMANGKAMRYGVGVARAGMEFEGEALVARKGRWPRWVPTPAMIKRNPEKYGAVAEGVPGGLDNPLGARALYLYQGGKDTLYRIHGTNEPWSIGKSVSSGCIRLLNQDIIDLHRRAPKGARVVVLGPNRKKEGEI